MIETIIQMLHISEYAGESELIDIAKGKHKIQDTVKGIAKQKKRSKAWRSRK